jgi:hypothetical protein
MKTKKVTETTMTAHKMTSIDLKRWNRLQLDLMQRLGIPLEPDHVLAFGAWFAGFVDSLGRLPRFSEVRTARASLTSTRLDG